MNWQITLSRKIGVCDGDLRKIQLSYLRAPKKNKQSTDGTTDLETQHILADRWWCLFDTSLVPSLCAVSFHMLIAVLFTSNIKSRTRQHIHDDNIMNGIVLLQEFCTSTKTPEVATESYELLVEGLKDVAMMSRFLIHQILTMEKSIVRFY